jgi:hypothetical protein
MNFYCSQSLWSIWQSLIPLSREQRTAFGEGEVTSDPAVALKSMTIETSEKTVPYFKAVLLTASSSPEKQTAGLPFSPLGLATNGYS